MLKSDLNILLITNRLDNKNLHTNGYKVYLTAKEIYSNVKFAEHHKIKIEDIQKADLILTFGTMLYESNIEEAHIIALNKRQDAIFALWYFDACNPDFGHCEHKYLAMQKIIPDIDWLFTTDASYDWSQHISNWHWLMQGIYEPEFSKAPQSNIKRREKDVIFTGGYLEYFTYRKHLLDTIARKYRLITYGRRSALKVYEDAFFGAYQKANVGFVPPPPDIVKNHYWSNRVFLATATGTPCVVGYVPGIEEFYEDGEEVLYFRDDTEMMTAIESLISNPALRERIGKAGRERTLKEHTYTKRIVELIDTIYGKAV
jgi:hypothetical protein